VGSVDDVPSEQRVIIRAHGMTPCELKNCEDKKLKIVDTTCPKVKKIHDIVSEYAEKGYTIIIIGDEDHPEVIGTKGWSKDTAHIVNDTEQIEFIKENDKVCVVSQTTMNIEKNKIILEEIKGKTKGCIAFDTICKATEERQNELRKLAKEVDLMIVIGDKESANSNRLYEISREICKNTQFIENIEELCLKSITKSCKIGVMAGASTPQFVIDEVVNKMKGWISCE
jgi:4-hydroxy-3-methylbut-2-enyl diphosphate reductase